MRLLGIALLLGAGILVGLDVAPQPWTAIGVVVGVVLVARAGGSP